MFGWVDSAMCCGDRHCAPPASPLIPAADMDQSHVKKNTPSLSNYMKNPRPSVSAPSTPRDPACDDLVSSDFIIDEGPQQGNPESPRSSLHDETDSSPNDRGEVETSELGVALQHFRAAKEKRQGDLMQVDPEQTAGKGGHPDGNGPGPVAQPPSVFSLSGLGGRREFELS